MPSILLSDAHPVLAHLWPVLLSKYITENPGHDLRITCTYRTPEEQQVLYAQGRTRPGGIVTQIDGVHTLSNHNHRPSRAIDFAVVIAGKMVWDVALYLPVGKLAEAAGLVWGGDWPHFKDYPHIELPKEIS